jgi:hypothetical protein
MNNIELPVYYAIKRKNDQEVLFMISITKEKYMIDETDVLSNIFKVYKTEKISPSEYQTYHKAFGIAASVEPDEIGQVIVTDKNEMECLGVNSREVEASHANHP